MNIFYKVHQLDGRVENFHLDINNDDIGLGLMNDIAKQVLLLTYITEEQFDAENTGTVIGIVIKHDKNKPNDAMGKKLGTLRHYEL